MHVKTTEFVKDVDGKSAAVYFSEQSHADLERDFRVLI